MRVPKGQKLWVTYRDERGRVRYAITSDPLRLNYILWKVYGDDMKKVKQAKSPKEFDAIAKGDLK